MAEGVSDVYKSARLTVVLTGFLRYNARRIVGGGFVLIKTKSRAISYIKVRCIFVYS